MKSYFYEVITTNKKKLNVSDFGNGLDCSKNPDYHKLALMMHTRRTKRCPPCLSLNLVVHLYLLKYYS
jgi:hypothetical protein